MAFPFTPLPIRQELFIDGAWVDITDPTRGENRITIRRGYEPEQTALSAGIATFTLTDPTGIYNNRNPSSPYYRKIGRNTRYRCGVDTGVMSVRLAGTNTRGTTTYDGSTVSCPDQAGLDITGDIDIRIDVEPDDWTGRAGHLLAGKYVTTGDQRSWALFTNPDGYVVFRWTTGGTTATAAQATSTVPLPSLSGRLAIQVTMDVDNGAAGKTITFYTASTLGGTYTILGSAVTTAGTTSIYSSSAKLEVGTVNNAAGPRATFGAGFDSDPLVGKIYAFELRQGLAGAGVLRARMNPTGQTEATTSWSDGVNTWSVAGSAYLSTQDFRFWGELPNRGYRSDLTGFDVTSPAQAGDVLQRFGQGQKALRSPIYRNLSQYDWDGYWTMEDSSGALETIGAVAGLPGYKKSADFTSAADLPGASGVLNFNSDDGYASGVVKENTTNNGEHYMLFYFKFGTLPAGTVTFLNVYFSYPSTPYRIDFKTDGTSYTMTMITSDGIPVDSATFGVGTYGAPDEWVSMRFWLHQDGPNVLWFWDWYQVGAPAAYTQNGSFAGAAGRPKSWISFSFTGKTGFQLGHVALGRLADPPLVFQSYQFYASTNGYVGESWWARAQRLAAEENVTLYIVGLVQRNGVDHGPFMGAQGTKTVIQLLLECADVAGGLLYAPRDKLGLAIRSQYAMSNRPALTLDYTAKHLSGQLQPDEVGDFVRNDITVTRPDGTFFHIKRTSGPLNVSDPDDDPEGVGPYETTFARNVSTDDELEAQALRELFIGTLDEMRYAGVQIETHRSPYVLSSTLTAGARALDIGSRTDITNLPAWLPPEDVALLVRGYTEVLQNFTQTITLSTVPYAPYLSGRWGSTTQSTTSLWAPASTTLKTGVASGATALTFTTPDVYETWSTTAEPYDVMIAGERITVTSMGSRTGTGPYEYIATVTRSVNGVVKALLAGEDVTLFYAGRWV